MLAALYARFSDDRLQTEKSIDDQLHECRRHAERLGATVVATFTDDGISAAAMANRPGVLALMKAARTRTFDVIITDELSRLTRDGGHVWDIYYDLEALGITIETPAEGRITELHCGLKGTINAVERKSTAYRVKRGLSGVIRSGRVASKPPYGYRRRREYDAAGEPIRGLIEIDPTQAPVVQRIHQEFAAGSTAMSITARLNADGVPGPSGGLWHPNALIGDARRMQGILRNPMYGGELVWNRATHPKSRHTGRALTRANAPADYVRHAAPALAIVPPETWAAVQRRLAETAERVKAAGNASAGNAPKRLFSGLLKCGVCGSALQTGGPGRRYRCRARTEKGPEACSNSRTAPGEAVEAEVLAKLRADLLHPDVVETVVRRYHEAETVKASGRRAQRTALQRDLGQVRRQSERLINQVAEGILTGRAVQAKVAELETRQSELEAELASLDATAEVVRIHPSAAGKYRELVEELQARLAAEPGDGAVRTAQREAARAALRKVIRRVLFHPGEKRGEWWLEIDGDLTALFEAAGAETSTKKRRTSGG